MSWARMVSAAQFAAAVAVILRILLASADPIGYTDDQTYEQTTYTVPVSSTENDSDIYRVPTKPLNLSSHGITSTTIELSWTEPEYANGIITGYRIYYMHSNFTAAKRYRINEDDGPVIEFVLKELEPDAEYEIWVKAYTSKHEGEPSDHITRRTDITGPSAPLILNVTCPTHDSVYIQWARPNIFLGSIDYYFINYRIENDNHYEEIKLMTEKNHLESAVRFIARSVIRFPTPFAFLSSLRGTNAKDHGIIQ